MVRLAEYSRDCMKTLRDELALDYEGRQLGTLQLFRSEISSMPANGISRCWKSMASPISHWMPVVVGLNRHWHGYVAKKIVGSLRLPGDETGDCFRFTKALAAEAQKLGGGICLQLRHRRD